MKKSKTIKAFLASLALVVTTGIVFASVAQAATKPKIKTVSHKTSTSITLPVSYKTLKNKKVKVKVNITNEKTNKKTTVTENAELNYLGEDSVKIEDLTASTEYSFKVKIKKTSSKNAKYSSWSSSKKVKTEDK